MANNNNKSMNTRTSIFYGVVGLEAIVSKRAIGDKAQQHEVSCGVQHRGQRCATEPLTQQSSLDIATIVHLQRSTDMSKEQLPPSYTYSTAQTSSWGHSHHRTPTAQHRHHHGATATIVHLQHSTDITMGPLLPSYTYSTAQT